MYDTANYLAALRNAVQVRESEMRDSRTEFLTAGTGPDREIARTRWEDACERHSVAISMYQDAKRELLGTGQYLAVP